jgi:hypothetical protein
MPVQGIHSQPLPLKNSRCWWLTTRNLATWEAEIRRIKVQDQPWGKKKIVGETPSQQKKTGHGGMYLSS